MCRRNCSCVALLLRLLHRSVIAVVMRVFVLMCVICVGIVCLLAIVCLYCGGCCCVVAHWLCVYIVVVVLGFVNVLEIAFFIVCGVPCSGCCCCVVVVIMCLFLFVILAGCCGGVSSLVGPQLNMQLFVCIIVGVIVGVSRMHILLCVVVVACVQLLLGQCIIVARVVCGIDDVVVLWLSLMVFVFCVARV